MTVGEKQKRKTNRTTTIKTVIQKLNQCINQYLTWFDMIRIGASFSLAASIALW
eukprot:m.65592 g.65592  ORF g.65592 m.65592 type:complete len:54 (+) comp12064_c1_seq3:1267-1428(+)